MPYGEKEIAVRPIIIVKYKRKFMKKFDKIKSVALVAMALMANVAVGQNLKVTSNGEPVENGAEINLPYVVEDYSVPGIIDEYFVYTWDPHIEASLAEGIEEMTVTVTSLDNSSGFQICWPSACQQVNPGESTSARGTVNDEPADLQIHKSQDSYSADVKPTEGGKIKVTIQTESESLELTVNCLLESENAVGENFVDVDENASYYTLEGIKVENPGKGVYIVRKGGAAKLIYKK